MRAAGCVVLGKTNVPEWLAGMHSENPLYGATRNPWDLSRSSGGSSGGASAAVAAGLAVTDLGNLPWPTGGLLEPMVSAIGPFARSAVDTALVTGVLLGADGLDAVGWRLDLPPARVTRLAGTRVAVWTDDPACPTDAETRAAVRGFADRLAGAGALVTELTAPPVGGPADLELFRRLQAAEVVHGFSADDVATMAARAAAGDPVAARYGQSVWSALTDLEAQRAATARWAEVFADIDVVLCPATSRVATTYTADLTAPDTVAVDGVRLPIDTVSDWSRLASLGRLPATVVPLGPGMRSGLPVGAQLLGAYLDDHTPLAVAQLAERAGLLEFRPPPSWT